eukprot:CAMPEP_0197877782 /NCGR_PEP_ID=MMETSP1439-20131203/6373_1 /TAXON_ID=66791 /ORGANISM="Gonyaulax spinifera, Strain CCMP409" /LENGTH=198 /DNA_ID=CAMNT_0043497153 /DNA_START=59 /DNA_END=655 /DNA_ORIENTATION=-
MGPTPATAGRRRAAASAPARGKATPCAACSSTLADVATDPKRKRKAETEEAAPVSVKVAALRNAGYADLESWLSDTGQNLYVGRRGRIFIHTVGEEKPRIFHYASSKWQNPFTVGKDGTREEVCAKFRTALLDSTLTDPADGKPLKEKLAELRGLRLGCWCKPEACHADVLAEVCNAELSNSTLRRRTGQEAGCADAI